MRPYKLQHSTKEYVEFECVQCGETARNTYSEPCGSEMKTHQLCWNCNYWRHFAATYKGEEMTIIEGCVYTPGNRTEGSFRGMAGRRFDIEYIAPSIFTGQRTTTFDLWAGGQIPEALRDKFPDTAKFLNGAERAQVGEIRSHSATFAETYPLPNQLKANQ